MQLALSRIYRTEAHVIQRVCSRSIHPPQDAMLMRRPLTFLTPHVAGTESSQRLGHYPMLIACLRI